MEHGPDDKILPEDETAPAVEQDNEAESEPVPSADALAFPSSPPAPSRVAGMLRGAMRVLLAFVFSQYFIVTVLISVAAMAISKTASDLLAAKFDAIARAIRHF